MVEKNLLIPNVSLIEDKGFFKKVGYIVMCSSVASTNIKFKRKEEEVYYKGDGDLFGTQLDAQKIYENFMKKGEFLCQGNVVFSSDGIMAPKKEVFLDSLAEFFNSDKVDASILYYSGHGFPGARILLETSLGSYEITYEELLSLWRNRSFPSINKHLLLLYDCCYSGEWVIKLMQSGDIKDVSMQASSSYYEKSQDFGSGKGSMFTSIFLSSNGDEVDLDKEKIEKKAGEFQPQFAGFKDICFYNYGLKALINSWQEILPYTRNEKQVFNFTNDKGEFHIEKIPCSKNSKLGRSINQSIFKFNKGTFTGQCEVKKPEDEYKYILYFISKNQDKYLLEDGVSSLYDYQDFSYGNLIYTKKRETNVINLDAELKENLEKIIYDLVKSIEENNTDNIPNVEYLYEELTRDAYSQITFSNQLKNEKFELYSNDKLTAIDLSYTTHQHELFDKLLKSAFTSDSLLTSIKIDLNNLEIQDCVSLLNLDNLLYLKDLSLINFTIFKDEDKTLNKIVKFLKLDKLSIRIITAFGINNSFSYDQTRIFESCHLNTKLKELDFSFDKPNQIGGDLLTQDLKKLFNTTNLKKFFLKNFSFENMNDNIFFMLDEGDIASLRQLKLENCNVRRFNPDLKLNLDYFNLRNNKLDDSLLKDLFTMISDSKNLKLDLSYNNFCNYDNLINRLSKTSGIKSIKLSGNYYSKRNLEKIVCDMCLNFSYISTLNLSYTNFSNINFIKNFLKNSPNIKALNMTYCSLSETSIKGIVDIFQIKNSNRINKLVLDGNKIYSNKTCNTIFITLKFNKYLSYLSMNDCFDLTFPEGTPDKDKATTLDKILSMKNLSNFSFQKNKTDGEFTIDISKLLNKKMDELKLEFTNIVFYYKTQTSETSVLNDTQKLLIESLSLDYASTYNKLTDYVVSDRLNFEGAADKQGLTIFEEFKTKSKVSPKMSSICVDENNYEQILEYINTSTKSESLSKSDKYVENTIQQITNCLKCEKFVLVDCNKYMFTCLGRSLHINEAIGEVNISASVLNEVNEDLKTKKSSNYGNLKNKIDILKVSKEEEMLNTKLDKYYRSVRKNGEKVPYPTSSQEISNEVKNFISGREDYSLILGENALIISDYPMASSVLEKITTNKINTKAIKMLSIRSCYETKRLLSKLSNYDFCSLEILELDSMNFCDLFDILVSIFQSSKITNLKSFIMKNMILQYNDIPLIQKLLIMNPKLEDFHIQRVHFEKDSDSIQLYSLFEYLNKDLKSLSLRYTLITKELYEAIDQYFNSIQKLESKSLVKLDLAYTYIFCKELETLLSYFINNDFKVLDISGFNTFEAPTDAVNSYFIPYSNVLTTKDVKIKEDYTKVSFTGQRFHEKSYISNFVISNPNITSYTFNSCFPDTDYLQSFSIIAQSLNNIQILKINNSPLNYTDSITVSSFIKNNNNLKEIHLTSCFLTEETGSSILEGIFYNKSQLDKFDQNSKLKSENDVLSTLVISDNFMGKLCFIKFAMIINQRANLEKVGMAKAFRMLCIEDKMVLYNILPHFDNYCEWNKMNLIGILEEFELI